MKRLIILLALIVSGSVAWAQPSFVVTVDSFDSQLSPYGSWLVLPGFGRVWQPGLEYVGDDFYPYGSSGQWVYTDEGWVFDSELPFAWAVFHYGRWMLDEDYGWVWVPGRTWAPAWVSWRMGGTYVGWAPMGPRGAPPVHHGSWLFVETQQLTVINVRSRAIDERRFGAAVTVTQPVHGAVPVGPPPAYVGAATRGQIRAVPVTQVRGGSRGIPPPPPPGQGSPSPRRIERAAPPARVESNRPIAPPPPPTMRNEPQRREPQFATPPPPAARNEPQRREPQFATPPPPAMRNEPREQQRSDAPPPPGMRNEPQRFAPPPPPPGQASPGQPSPQPVKQRQQQGPPPPPSRRGPR